MNRKRFFQWRLTSLLVVVTVAAAMFAVWTRVVVPFDQQAKAKENLENATEKIEAKKSWLSFIDQERFSRVRVFQSRTGDLDDADLSDIGYLHYLQSLDLSTTNVTDHTGRSIGKLKQLKHLNLSGTRISDQGLPSIAKCTGLTKLNLHDTCISDDGLEHLLPLKQLRELSLSETICGPGLLYVVKLRQLDKLDLSRTTVDDKGLLNLAGCTANELLLKSEIPGTLCETLASMPNLQTVNTAIVDATDSDVTELAKCKQLEQINISGGTLSDASIATLCNQLPGLHELEAAGELTDQSLATIGECKSLQRVTLVGDFSPAAINELRKLRPSLLVSAKAPSTTDNSKPEHIGSIYRKSDSTYVLYDTIGELLKLPKDVASAVQFYQPSFTVDLTALATVKEATDLAFIGQYGTTSFRGPMFQLTWSLPQVKALTLVGQSCDDELIKQIYRFSGVQRLVIRGANISDRSLALLGAHKQLQDLSLEAKYLVGSGFSDLAKCKSLQKLELRYLKINDIYWAGLRKCESIEELLFSFTKSNDETCKQISQLPNLQQLNLGNTNITDRGLEYLGQSKSLRSVQFGSAEVTVNGLRSLAKCKSLEVVRLGSVTKISAFDLEEIRTEFIGLTID